MNKVTLIGNVTRDLELKTYKNGNEEGRYVQFTLAIDEYNRKTNEKIATFINVVAFNRKAEVLSKYITKGRKLAVEGKIRAESYINGNGEKKYSVEIILEDFTFVDSPKKIVNEEIPF